MEKEFSDKNNIEAEENMQLQPPYNEVVESNEDVFKQRAQNIWHYLKRFSPFFIAALIIVLVFPSGMKFKYAYELGKPWMYGTLYAPFSYSILKSDSEIERDYIGQLRNYYKPCYHIDNEVTEKVLNDFERKAPNIANNMGDEYVRYLKKSLKDIYKKGVMTSDDHNEVEKIGMQQIRVSTQYNSEAEEESIYEVVDFKNVYTIKSAYQSIIRKAPKSLDSVLIQRLNINELLKCNLIFDKKISEKQRENCRKSVSATGKMVQKGQKIIVAGDLIGDEQYAQLKSLQKIYEQDNSIANTKSVNIGQFVCTLCFLTAFFLYLMLFREKFYNKQNVIFMLGLIVGMCCLTAGVVKIGYDLKIVSVYIIPYALVPITISAFFDTRTALFTHLTTVLICSLIAPEEFQFLLLQVVSGMICISTLKHFYQRSQLFITAAVMGGLYILTYLGLVMVYSSGWDDKDTVALVSFIINATLLLFTYPLIFIFEKMFDFVSDITLVELTNSNNPLLREFSEKAPGSFQHSMQVSNLASYAADSIGGNALLARAGALYHDIGKMHNPIYFTENQNGYNPHRPGDEKESARRIIRHVEHGLKTAARYNLPKRIQDFISTHHGHNVVGYFYTTYSNSHPDEVVDKADFAYPYELPNSKETAIVMMCDAVEAASRSMKDYTQESISKLVNNIVNSQLSSGAFANAPITLKQIETVKSTLVEKIINMYHSRIRYPELNKNTKTSQAEQQKEN
ncbi:MAG: HDIG domain-containing protein [Bacteroidales bacterium]|nr:HDIG domain-containing protein [Candidatus Physcocola equi]